MPQLKDGKSIFPICQSASTFGGYDFYVPRSDHHTYLLFHKHPPQQPKGTFSLKTSLISAAYFCSSGGRAAQSITHSPSLIYEFKWLSVKPQCLLPGCAPPRTINGFTKIAPALGACTPALLIRPYGRFNCSHVFLTIRILYRLIASHVCRAYVLTGAGPDNSAQPLSSSYNWAKDPDVSIS